MKKLITSMAIASVLGLSATAANAAPVPGFDRLYTSVVNSCSPASTRALCEAAINRYAAALIAARIPLNVANQSFLSLRVDVRLANGGNARVLTEIDSLFQDLLPETRSVGPIDASPVL